MLFLGNNYYWFKSNHFDIIKHRKPFWFSRFSLVKFESSLIGKILNFKFNKNGSKPLIRAMLLFIVDQILSFLVIVLAILVSVAYLTLAERKIMGSMQQRTGPNVVGFFGLLQPLADGLKLLLKETVIPTNANTFGFVVAPIMTLLLSLFG